MTTRFVKGLSLCLAFAAALGCTQTLGPQASSPELKGRVANEEVFRGAGLSEHLYIDGAHLKEGKDYEYTGTLTVNGDIPAKASIHVTNGKLEVTGDVGSNAKLTADLPVNTHQEEYYYTTLIPAGQSFIPVMQVGYTTVIDGLKYPDDPSPAITVKGNIGNKTDIKASYGGNVKVGCYRSAPSQKGCPSPVG